MPRAVRTARKGKAWLDGQVQRHNVARLPRTGDREGSQRPTAPGGRRKSSMDRGHSRTSGSNTWRPFTTTAERLEAEGLKDGFYVMYHLPRLKTFKFVLFCF